MTPAPQTESPNVLFKGERLVVYLLWAGAFITFIQHFVYAPFTQLGWDYIKHWEAAVGIFEGNSPYAPEFYNGFNYPLFAILPSLHLSLVDLNTGDHLWDIGNALFILASACIIAWGVPIQTLKQTPDASPGEKCRFFLTNHWKPIVFLTIFSYQSAHQVILLGNIEPLSFILSSSFCVLYIRRKQTWAGIFLALFALIKLAPVLLLIPLLVGKRYRIIITCLATLSLYGVLLLITGYWRWEIVFYREIVPWIAWEWQEISCSIHLFIADHFFPHVLESSKPYEKLIFIINLVCMALYGIYLAAWMKWTKKNGDALLVFGYGMILVFTPLLEINHFLWIFPAFFLMLYLWIHEELNHYMAFIGLMTWLLTGSLQTVHYLFLIYNTENEYADYLPWTIILVIHTFALGGLAWSARQPSTMPSDTNHPPQTSPCNTILPSLKSSQKKSVS